VMAGNAEVGEYWQEVVKTKLILDHPDCLRNALMNIKVSELRIIFFQLRSPIFSSATSRAFFSELENQGKYRILYEIYREVNGLPTIPSLAPHENLHICMEPLEIRRAIKGIGARAVLIDIYEDWDEWDALLDHIVQGNREWLEIANLLKPVSDAGASEMLDIAVGEALERQPEYVLTVALKIFDLDLVCAAWEYGMPGYETPEQAIGMLEARIESLERLKDNELLPVRNECIEVIRDEIIRLEGIGQESEAEIRRNDSEKIDS
jgi:hypothetical protein